METYLTAAKAAERLHLTPMQVGNLCRSGKLRAFKPSGMWLITETDLIAFVESGSNQTDAGAA